MRGCGLPALNRYLSLQTQQQLEAEMSTPAPTASMCQRFVDDARSDHAHVQPALVQTRRRALSTARLLEVEGVVLRARLQCFHRSERRGRFQHRMDCSLAAHCCCGATRRPTARLHATPLAAASLTRSATHCTAHSTTQHLLPRCAISRPPSAKTSLAHVETYRDAACKQPPHRSHSSFANSDSACSLSTLEPGR